MNSFTPTATPCNSPDGTPPSSRCGSPEPSDPLDVFSLPQLILSSVPQFLKDTVSGAGGYGGAKKKTSFTKNKRETKQDVGFILFLKVMG